MPWRPTFDGEAPTLGFLAVDWMTAMLAAPSKADYAPFTPYREQEDFLFRFYELNPTTGRFRFERGLLGRPRGWGKSPLLAAIACFEALGPCLFDGWDAEGQPVGKPWSEVRTPLVHIAAVSEDQTRNTWQPLLEMLREGPAVDAYPGLEPMDTFVALPKGAIRQVTSSARSVKGAPSVLGILDQALALDTPIPTPFGWTTMGALESGDIVVGSGGQPVKVTEAKPVSLEHGCYQVTFADGTSVVASEGHLWQTKVAGSAAKPKVRTTGEMLDGRTYRIPVAPAVDSPTAPVAVPPYLLGFWLGDGTRGKCELSVSERDLEDVQAALLEVGVESWPRRYSGTGKGYSTGPAAVNLTFTQARGFAMVDRPQVAKDLQALTCYRNKHVPQEYLQGSIAQRTGLLRGLMDSDGSCSEQGVCTFVNTSRSLAEAVVALLRSLGQVTSGAKWVVDDRFTGGGKFRVDFTARGGLQPFRLRRKAQRVRQHSRGAEWITIRSIRLVERVPVRCIAVDSTDHLFAAGAGGHLTHNTEEWVPSNNGPRLAQTIRTNCAKNGGRTIESPNAYVPGEGSVAEKSAEALALQIEGRTKAETVFYDHREAPPETDMSDRESLIAGLRFVYGDSSGHPDGCVLHEEPCPPGHMDLDSVVATIWDPATDVQIARSDWLNQITHASDAWLSSPEWAACVDATKVVADRDVIALGFDGSRGRNRGTTDATALIGCRIADRHVFEIGVWEQPRTWNAKLHGPWMVPVGDVEAAVKDTFGKFTVAAFYADPARWESQVASWEATYGAKLARKASREHPIEWWMTGARSRTTVQALEQFQGAVLGGELTHDGSSTLTRHVLNARRRMSRSGLQIAKEHPDSSNKIDAAVAATIAYTAALDCIAAGVGLAAPRRSVPRRLY